VVGVRQEETTGKTVAAAAVAVSIALAVLVVLVWLGKVTTAVLITKPFLMPQAEAVVLWLLALVGLVG
jgi:hypothetical protein